MHTRKKNPGAALNGILGGTVSISGEMKEGMTSGCQGEGKSKKKTIRPFIFILTEVPRPLEQPT